MTRITVDAATAAKLNGLGEYLEFCDEAGNVLGHFEPDQRSPLFREWLRTVEPGITPEEMQRRINDRSGGFTTEEVLARLRSKAS